MTTLGQSAKTAMDEASAKGLNSAATVEYVRQKLVDSYGDLPIKCTAGWLTDIASKTDGTPIFRIEKSPAIYQRIPVDRD